MGAGSHDPHRKRGSSETLGLLPYSSPQGVKLWPVFF